ncbi:MAG TPA: sugar porter family MFS transporter [Candidatus Acidoferrales bacterium]|jgi:SP family galactose:H+ symporter-like MFS transporter|nr:sugar porter family MFS transporter [Candidatus Acidoferrales bacterium]
MTGQATSPGGAAASTRAPGRRFVYLAAVFAGLGGLLFGYDTGVISGAELFFKNDFSLSTFALEVIVSGVLAGAAAGALAGGRLADLFGRRRLLIVTAIIFALGAVLCAAATSVTILIAGRIIVGLGIGLSSGTVPVYISEVAPADARGWTVSLFQLAITLGILLAYIVDYAFSKSEAWRWMFGLSLIPAAIFGIGMYFLPESPRWLARNGHHDRARAVLEKIRDTSLVHVELEEIEHTLAQSQEHGNWRDLLSPSLRPALVVGIGLAVFQQVTGINTVIYYAPLIIQSAGISSASGAILATAGIGVVNVLMTIVSMWLIDRIGRRPLLLTGIAGMIVTLGVLGWAFYSNERSAALSSLAVISMMVYVASFAISLGPIFWLLIAEIYPLRVRSSSEGLAATFNWGANLLVTLTFLTLLQKIGAPKTFWLYGICAVGALVFSYRLVPETKGRTLEQIEQFWRT